MDIKVLEVELHELKCSNCGASLKFHPGQQAIVCKYCGATNTIEYTEEQVAKAWEEKDFEEHLTKIANEDLTPKSLTVKCPGCGAQVEVEDRTIATVCPYCGTSLTLSPEQIQRQIKPQGIVPFKVDKKEAKHRFVKWARSRWFAPSNFKKNITAPSRFKALYVPYWTFDADTVTDYEGQRGVYYYETVTYTDSDGNEATREERRTEWTPVSGTVRVQFDDVLINGKHDLVPVARVRDWNLKEMKPYDPKFIAGYDAETYTISIKDAFEQAKKVMDYEIIQAIRRDIGGDEQRIDRYNTYYNDITFKHILVPLYTSSFKYKGKEYLFAINGQSGEVTGKFPISVFKVILIILLIVLIIGFMMIYSQYDGDFSQMWHSIFGFVSVKLRLFSLFPNIHAFYPI